jgi:hypothetical protein
MAAQLKANPWLRWFAAAEPSRSGWWRLIRFEQVDADGKPIGKAVVSMTPSNFPRNFPTEAVATGAAEVLNGEEGR